MEDYLSPNWHEIVNYLLQYYTQNQIADKTGIDQSRISKIKNSTDHTDLIYECGKNLVDLYRFTKYQEERK